MVRVERVAEFDRQLADALDHRFECEDERQDDLAAGLRLDWRSPSTPRLRAPCRPRIRFSIVFLRSSSCSSLASLAFIPPYGARRR
jgi:hypothetical protein